MAACTSSEPPANPRVSIAPYGTWASPLSATRVTAGALRFDDIVLDGDDVYWLEGRPSEGGRQVVVRRSSDGRIEDVTPLDMNVRSRVHEYGGAAYTVHRGTIYFSNFSDQRLYRLERGSAPQALTDEGFFFADCVVDMRRARLLCVREDHTRANAEPVNTIAAVALGPGGPAARRTANRTLVSGADFYSDPVISPDGTKLAWLQWNHPNMPWDGTELWVSTLEDDGTLGRRERIAGGSDESIFQPSWSPDGTLYWVSDITGWWNLYRRRGGDTEPIHPKAAEFGKAQWTFSMVTYAFITAERLAVTYTENGRWRLALVETDPRKFEPIRLTLDPLESIRADSRAVYFIGGSTTDAPAIARMTLAAVEAEVLRRSSPDRLEPAWISVPEAISYQTGPRMSEADVHAFYYAPKNPDFVAPEGEKPPLLVLTHGGPTGATEAVLDAEIQFWTSRGFALLDVNYRGSTGYGRAYRDRLKGTHKFESRYLDSLIGPYPASKDLYRARSPIHFVDRLSAALILFQGLEDKVVPPNQSQMMADSLRKKGLPVAYLTYPGEQHGFRQAENIVRSLEAELAFYGAVFGFAPADRIEPVTIDNLR
ncbi:MAG: prolyl oligopeptidase family serine peptidase [Acidobacteria bacterium]|nr:prolyl oligopeptidase family serine peptidase [Acidobacteriota bacterium]